MDNVNTTQTIGEDIEHLAHELKLCLNRFQQDPTPENFAPIVSSLRGFGLSGKDLWREALSYTRRYPLRVAIFAGIVFYALKGISETAKPKALAAQAEAHLH